MSNLLRSVLATLLLTFVGFICFIFGDMRGQEKILAEQKCHCFESWDFPGNTPYIAYGYRWFEQDSWETARIIVAVGKTTPSGYYKICTDRDIIHIVGRPSL